MFSALSRVPVTPDELGGSSAFINPESARVAFNLSGVAPLYFSDSLFIAGATSIDTPFALNLLGDEDWIKAFEYFDASGMDNVANVTSVLNHISSNRLAVEKMGEGSARLMAVAAENKYRLYVPSQCTTLFNVAFDHEFKILSTVKRGELSYNLLDFSLFKAVEPPTRVPVEPRPSDPPQPIKEQKSFWQRVKSWTPTVTLELGEKTKGALNDATAKVKEVADRFDTKVDSVIQKITGVLPEFLQDPKLQEWICLLCDVVSLSMCDATVAVIMQPRLYIQYGFTTSITMDALVAFFRYLYRRFLRPEDQNDGQVPSPEDKAVEEAGWSAMISAVYYYTLGSIPTSIPVSIVKTLVGLNAGFSLLRNLEHFSLYIVKAIKWVVDAVWQMLTGKPWFDQGQAEVIKDMIKVAEEVDRLISSQPTAANIASIRTSLEKADKLLALGAARELDKERLQAFESFVAKTRRYLQSNTMTAEYTDQRPPCVSAHFFGDAGIGKTLFVRLFHAALHKRRGYTEDPKLTLATYMKNVNFQPEYPAAVKILHFDDPMLINNKEAVADFFQLLADLGSSVPLMQDSPSEPKKGTLPLRPEVSISVDNKWSPNTGLNTEEAAARRYIGGIHRMQVTKPYRDPQGRLIASKLAGANEAEIEQRCNEAWIFTDHNGIVRNFSEIVCMIDFVVVDTAKTGAGINRVVSALAANFKGVDSVLISPAPKYLPNMKQSLHYQAAKDKDATKGKEKEKSTSGDSLPSLDVSSNEEDIEDQSFTNFGSEKALSAFLTTPKVPQSEHAKYVSRVKKWMEMDSNEYKFQTTPDAPQGAVFRNGEKLSADFFSQKYVSTAPVAKGNLRTPISEWGPDENALSREATFYFKKSCCRYQNYCYRCGSDGICDAYDDNAKSGGYKMLAHWALDNPDLKPRWKTTYEITAAMHSPFEDDPKLALLNGLAWGFGSAIASVFVAYLFNKFIVPQSTLVTEQAYSTRAAAGSRRTKDKTLPMPGVGTSKPSDHGNEVDPGKTESRYAHLTRVLNKNTIPMITTNISKATLKCYLTRVHGNLAFTVRHAFFEGATHIVVGGNINQKVPIHYIDNLSKASDVALGVQVCKSPDYDFAFLILPKSWDSCESIRDKLASISEELESFTDCCIQIPQTDVELNAGLLPIPKQQNPSKTPFNLGDVQGAYHYQSSASYRGIYIKSKHPTQKGHCGCLVWTCNPRVGRGSAVIFGMLTAYIHSSNTVIVCPISSEMLDNFIAQIPPKVCNFVEAQSDPTFLEPPIPLGKDNIDPLIVGTLPRNESQHLNTKNSIRIYDQELAHCLTGLEVYDPVIKKTVVVPPISVAPAPLHRTLDALDKIKTTNHVPDEDTYHTYLQAMEETKEQVLRFTDPKLIKPQNELFSILEALNGVSELNIPGLDPKKSPGFIHGVKAPSRSVYVEVDERGYMTPTTLLIMLVEQYTTQILNGKMPSCFVVQHLKEELRALLPLSDEELWAVVKEVHEDLPDLTHEDGRKYRDMHPEEVYELVKDLVKQARVTSAYAFPLLVTMRRFTMHLPSMLISGKIHNGVAVGADLNSGDGQEVGEAFSRLKYQVNLDAKNYDASKSSYYSHPAEEVAADFVQLRFPFLSREAAIIPAMLARCVYLVFGIYVWYIWWAMQSGHPLTTFLNCLTSSATARTAFLKGDFPHRYSFDRDVFSLCYGDDLRAASDIKGYTNKLLKETGHDLGITYSDGKNKFSQEVPDHTNFEDADFLKAQPWQDKSGYWMFRINIETVSHVHAFIKGKDKNPRAAVQQNGEMALRLWFYWGRATYDKVRARLNTHYKRLGLSTITLEWDQLYEEWFNRQDGDKLVRGKRYSFEVAKVTLQDALKTAKWSGDIVEDQSNPVEATESVTSAIKDTTTVSKINTMSAGQVSADSGVQSRSGLTVHVDSTVLSSTKPVMASTRTPFFPGPPANAEGPLRRNYILKTVTWPTSSASGTVLTDGVFQFPEDAFTIPKYAATVAIFRRIRGGIEISARVGGTDYVGGMVKMAFLKGHVNGNSVDEWREDPFLLQQGPGIELSAGMASAVSMRLPWTDGHPWYDLLESQPVAAIGSIYLVVGCPLLWNSPTPPDSIDITIEICWYDVTLDGYGTTPAPPLDRFTYAMRKRHKQVAKVTRVSAPRPKQTLADSLKYAGISKDVVEDQSAKVEAVNKATDGVLTGVGSAVKTVEAVVQTGEKLMPLLGLLDKPNSVAAAQPVYFQADQSWTNTEGVQTARFLSAPTLPYVSRQNDLVGEANPQPSWLEICKTPGWLADFSVPHTASPGDVVWRSHIYPTACQDPDGGGPSAKRLLTPLAHAALHHTRWFGDIKLLFRYFGPKSQAIALQTFIVPDLSPLADISTTQSGDPESISPDFRGDANIPVLCRWSSMFTSCKVVSPYDAITKPIQCPWQVIVKVVRPPKGQIDVSTAPFRCRVWIAAGDNFMLFGPCGFPETLTVSLVAPSSDLTPEMIREQNEKRANALSKAIKALARKPTYRDEIEDQSLIVLQPLMFGGVVSKDTSTVEDQASVRDLFGKEFSPLIDSKPVYQTGVTSMDYCRGPVDFLKRPFFATAITNTTSLTDNPIVAQIPSEWYTLLHPWKGWSGGLGYVVTMLASSSPSCIFYVSQNNGLGSHTAVLTGPPSVSYQNKLEWMIAHSDVVPVKEIMYSRAPEVLEFPDQAVVTTYNGAGLKNQSIAMLASLGKFVADDFSLYHYESPGFVIQTGPMPETNQSKIASPKGASL